MMFKRAVSVVLVAVRGERIFVMVVSERITRKSSPLFLGGGGGGAQVKTVTLDLDIVQTL